MRPAALLVTVVVLLGGVGAEGSAQARAVRAGFTAPAAEFAHELRNDAAISGAGRWAALEGGDTAAKRQPRPTAWAILASAALAGSGQAMLGQRRFLAYLAVEGILWTKYVQDQREGRSARRDYRNIAAEFARSQFTPNPRPGDWDYYERMEKFVESGAFDRNPGGDLLPEADTSTYNGSVWLLARETYWNDPNQEPPRTSEEWRRAELFYRSRAVGPDRQWSWRASSAAYDQFRHRIRQSNDAFRRSLADIGVVIANHALSTVDAFVTVRLRQRPSLRDGYSLELEVPFDVGRRVIGGARAP
jgi:hypothetical protein